MASKAATHRVVCADHTHEAFSLEQAIRHRTEVERLGKCHLVHIIEVYVDGQWLPRGVARAREVLAASIGDVMDSPDGPLTKTSGSWSRETTERADAAAHGTTDFATWRAALGPHERAILTADGQDAHLYDWCTCPQAPNSLYWIRYERWIAVGRASHGYLCPHCRMIIQTG